MTEDTKEEQFGYSLNFWKSGLAFEIAPCADVPSVTWQSYLGCDLPSSDDVVTC